MNIEMNIFTVLGKGFEECVREETAHLATLKFEEYVREETAHLATLKSKKIIS
jgi:hypothetical protein